MKKREYNFTKPSHRGVVRTKLEIISSLQDFASSKETDSFTQKEYDAWKDRVLCSSHIANRFGSWAQAMHEAGLKPIWSNKKDVAKMVEIYMDCWEEQDDIPTERIFVAYLKKYDYDYSVHMYKKHFGGWRRLAQRVIDFQEDKISEKQLLEKYKPKKESRRPIPLSLRNKVLAHDDYQCKQCGKSAKDDGVVLEVDHIRPVSAGGKNDLENLQTLCFECNRGKRDSIPL